MLIFGGVSVYLYHVVQEEATKIIRWQHLFLFRWLGSTDSTVQKCRREKQLCIKPRTHDKIRSNYRDLTRPGAPNGGLVREIPLFQGNLGW